VRGQNLYIAGPALGSLPTSALNRFDHVLKLSGSMRLPEVAKSGSTRINGFPAIVVNAPWVRR